MRRNQQKNSKHEFKNVEQIQYKNDPQDVQDLHNKRQKKTVLTKVWNMLFKSRRGSNESIRKRMSTTSEISAVEQIQRTYVPHRHINRHGNTSSMDNIQLIDIPIEPGKRVSTIVIKPTKTGVTAMIAQYDVDRQIQLPQSASPQTVKLKVDVDKVKTRKRNIAVGFPNKDTCVQDKSLADENGEICQVHHIADIHDVPDIFPAQEVFTRVFESAKASESDRDHERRKGMMQQAQVGRCQEGTYSIHCIHSAQSMHCTHAAQSIHCAHCAFCAHSTHSIHCTHCTQPRLLQDDVEQFLHQLVFIEHDSKALFEQLQHGDTNRSDVSRRSHQSGNRPVSPEMFRNVKPFKEFLIKEEKDTRDDMDTFHQIDHVRQVHVKGKDADRQCHRQFQFQIRKIRRSVNPNYWRSTTEKEKNMFEYQNQPIERASTMSQTKVWNVRQQLSKERNHDVSDLQGFIDIGSNLHDFMGQMGSIGSMSRMGHIGHNRDIACVPADSRDEFFIDIDDTDHEFIFHKNLAHFKREMEPEMVDVVDVEDEPDQAISITKLFEVIKCRSSERTFKNNVTVKVIEVDYEKSQGVNIDSRRDVRKCDVDAQASQQTIALDGGNSRDNIKRKSSQETDNWTNSSSDKVQKLIYYDTDETRPYKKDSTKSEPNKDGGPSTVESHDNVANINMTEDENRNKIKKQNKEAFHGEGKHKHKEDDEGKNRKGKENSSNKNPDDAGTQKIEENRIRREEGNAGTKSEEDGTMFNGNQGSKKATEKQTENMQTVEGVRLQTYESKTTSLTSIVSIKSPLDKRHVTERRARQQDSGGSSRSSLTPQEIPKAISDLTDRVNLLEEQLIHRNPTLQQTSPLKASDCSTIILSDNISSNATSPGNTDIIATSKGDESSLTTTTTTTSESESSGRPMRIGLTASLILVQPVVQQLHSALQILDNFGLTFAVRKENEEIIEKIEIPKMVVQKKKLIHSDAREPVFITKTRCEWREDNGPTKILTMDSSTDGAHFSQLTIRKRTVSRCSKIDRSVDARCRKKLKRTEARSLELLMKHPNSGVEDSNDKKVRVKHQPVVHDLDGFKILFRGSDMDPGRLKDKARSTQQPCGKASSSVITIEHVKTINRKIQEEESHKGQSKEREKINFGKAVSNPSSEKSKNAGACLEGGRTTRHKPSTVLEKLPVSSVDFKKIKSENISSVEKKNDTTRAAGKADPRATSEGPTSRGKEINKRLPVGSSDEKNKKEQTTSNKSASKDVHDQVDCQKQRDQEKCFLNNTRNLSYTKTEKKRMIPVAKDGRRITKKETQDLLGKESYNKELIFRTKESKLPDNRTPVLLMVDNTKQGKDKSSSISGKSTASGQSARSSEGQRESVNRTQNQSSPKKSQDLNQTPEMKCQKQCDLVNDSKLAVDDLKAKKKLKGDNNVSVVGQMTSSATEEISRSNQTVSRNTQQTRKQTVLMQATHCVPQGARAGHLNPNIQNEDVYSEKSNDIQRSLGEEKTVWKPGIPVWTYPADTIKSSISTPEDYQSLMRTPDERLSLTSVPVEARQETEIENNGMEFVRQVVPAARFLLGPNLDEPFSDAANMTAELVSKINIQGVKRAFDKIKGTSGF